MKKLLSLLLLILIGCSEPEPLNYQMLVQRDGLYYLKDTNEIYSGPVFNIEGKSEGTLKKGKFHGQVKTYYDNGQLKSEGTYKNGTQDGLFTQWYVDGKKKSEVKYNKGIVGLINYFSIQGDTLISNDNKNMELVVNDYEQFLNGKWLLDKNNSTEVEVESEKVIFEFNEQTWTVKYDGEIESIGVDYNRMTIEGGSSIFLNIIDFNNVDLNLYDGDDLELGVRLIRINNNL